MQHCSHMYEVVHRALWQRDQAHAHFEGNDEAKDLVDEDKAGKGPISLWIGNVSLELATTGVI